jgi:hypothetical protein
MPDRYTIATEVSADVRATWRDGEGGTLEICRTTITLTPSEGAEPILIADGEEEVDRFLEFADYTRSMIHQLAKFEEACADPITGEV